MLPARYLKLKGANKLLIFQKRVLRLHTSLIEHVMSFHVKSTVLNNDLL